MFTLVLKWFIFAILIDEYLYDMDCVNEALVNAIVHNDWTISEPLVSFYNDRIEITSHGGIPKDMSKE